MEKILLVEPNYKNKYPPIGLMKISSYYKNKGDFVELHKGLLSVDEVSSFDKVLITTLFTFDFKMCIETISYYIEIKGIKNVFVGGIAATIMPDMFKKAIPHLQLLTGQLTSSDDLGYDDNINIDILELDYDILWDIPYVYPSANSYFIYSTRGCPRKCDFCAVKTLEPKFLDCNNIKDQIERVDKNFGIKKNLLIMDNNILFSNKLSDTINDIYSLGFGKDNNLIKKSNPILYYINSLENRVKVSKKYNHLLQIIKDEFLSLTWSRITKDDKKNLEEVIKIINHNSDLSLIKFLCNNKKEIVDFFNRYHYHKIRRHIDFNQGLDARLFTIEKAELIGKLAINPCRIAFDNVADEKVYFNAMEMAVTAGINRFSNYILYNFEDSPSDLWKRLYLNVLFAKTHDISVLFSFPMKYASIEHTDRTYIGTHWNRKYLRAINVILNVTSGVVAKEEDFFLRAFGETDEEFKMILTMPDDFIRYRDFFQSNNFINSWRKRYYDLSGQDLSELLSILSGLDFRKNLTYYSSNKKIAAILPYYYMKKNKVDSNFKYYVNFLKKEQIHFDSFCEMAL